MMLGASSLRCISQPFLPPHPRRRQLCSTSSSNRRLISRFRSNVHPILCKDKAKVATDSDASAAKRSSKVLLNTVNANTVEGADNKAEQPFLQPVSVSIPVGDRHILVETGVIGRQASGSVKVTDGETVIYTSVCVADDASQPADFFPLSVHYQERFSAAGRTSGGFFKREGRLKENEVLICRLIDRPLRPTITKGFYNETQILAWVLSYDGLHSPDSIAITAAAVALALSEVPISQTVAGVRVGLIEDQFVINPTVKQMKMSKLDLLLAGTAEAVLMIEGYCDFLSEELLLQAVEIGQGAVRDICKEIDDLVCKSGKVKMTNMIRLPPPDLYEHVEDLSGRGLIEALKIKSKIPRMKAISSLEKKVISALSGDDYRREYANMNALKKEDATSIFERRICGLEEHEEDEEVVDGEIDEGDVHIKSVLRKSITKPFDPVDVKLAFKEITSKLLRKCIVQEGRRSDGRHETEIRKIQSQCGLLPRAHGSALFTRGETQSLAVTTLGGSNMGQRLDNLTDVDDLKRFYLQYSFPPSAVGEVGRIGGPSRREIGHGMLAERALEQALPSEDDFPYVIRVESTITESNGSSSMASVCGGCLALLDAGVPLKCSIAGIAMGMVFNTQDCGGDGTPVILSDIIGSEDALGDMDFKVAGNEMGITAFQMDLKTTGITVPIMKQALTQARKGICHILAEMSKCSPAPSRRLSMHAPRIHCMKVPPEKVNIIIGAGGKTVKNIIDETGVEYISGAPNGLVKIFGKDMQSLEKAISMINGLVMVPTVGDIFRNCEVKSIAPYGAFVEITPGREGLLHISELSTKFVSKAEDIVKVGERLDVKLIEINERGHFRLSRRALLQNEDQEKGSSQESTAIKERSTKESPSAVKEEIIKESNFPAKQKFSPVKYKLTSKELASTQEGSTQINGHTSNT